MASGTPSPTQRPQAPADTFRRMINDLDTVSKSGSLIMDTQFNVFDRHAWLSWGAWKLTILSLLRPFFYCCGDTLSHYRVNNVAKAILEACQDNQALLKSETTLQSQLSRAVGAFNTTRTHKTHDDTLQRLHTGVARLFSSTDDRPGDVRHRTSERDRPAPTASAVEAGRASHVRAPSMKLSARPHEAFEMKWPEEEEMEYCKVTLRWDDERDPLYSSMEPQAASELREGIARLVGLCDDGSHRLVFRIAERDEGEVVRKLLAVNADKEIVDEVTTPVSLQVAYDSRGQLQIYRSITARESGELRAGISRLLESSKEDPSYRLAFSKEEDEGACVRKLQVLNAEGTVVEEITTPVSLEVVYDDEGKLQDIVLLSKEVVGRGGQTNARLCLSLGDGNQYVRKVCTDPYHRAILEWMRDNPARGLVGVKGIRTSGVEGQEKVQVLENFWEGNLVNFMLIPRRAGSKPPFQVLLQMARDIVSGVAAFHQIPSPKLPLSDGTMLDEFRMFHLDIAPKNILAHHEGQAVLSDFGCAHPENNGGSLGWRSPTYVRQSVLWADIAVEELPQHAQEIATYNIRNGQKNDVWSLGLTLAALFAWETNPQGDPPLPCIRDCLPKREEPADPLKGDRRVATLTQALIERDLAQLQAQGLERVGLTVAQRVAMQEVWDVIRQMLRVNPDERKITAAGAAKRLQALLTRVEEAAAKA